MKNKILFFILMYYASNDIEIYCKTLKASSSMPLILTLFQLGSTNPKKNSQTLDIFLSTFFLLENKITIFFLQKCSNLHERYGMCWNVWKIDFPIFIFRAMVIFVLKIWSTFDEFSPITRKLKIIQKKISFSFRTFRIFHKNLTTSEGGLGVGRGLGLHILTTWDSARFSMFTFMYRKQG